MADVAGLRRLAAGFAPLTASTYGVGQVISAALAERRRSCSGSAAARPPTAAQGWCRRSASGSPARAARIWGEAVLALAGLAAVDPAGLDPRVATATILVASDVDNPLLGPSGAAAVFGPQKGASPADIAVLDRALARWAALTRAVTGRDVACEPGAGAAGGTGFAALAYLGARLVPGAGLLLDLIGFDDALAGRGPGDHWRGQPGPADAGRQGAGRGRQGGGGSRDPRGRRGWPGRTVRCRTVRCGVRAGVFASPISSPTRPSAWPRPRRSSRWSAPRSPPTCGETRHKRKDLR